MSRAVAVRWREAAIEDLEIIDAWLCSFEQAKPQKARERIGQAIYSLERLGDIGRPGKAPGTRELRVRGAPNIIVYVVDSEGIEIIAIGHMAART